MPVSIEVRPITVIETQSFVRSAEKLWSEDEIAALVDFVACSPDAGTIIPGTGGVRKLRWALPGGGKRGGARVIYFYYRADCPLYLLLAYAKARSTDLSPTEKASVSALAAAIGEAADARRDKEG